MVSESGPAARVSAGRAARLEAGAAHPVRHRVHLDPLGELRRVRPLVFPQRHPDPHLRSEEEAGGGGRHGSQERRVKDGCALSTRMRTFSPRRVRMLRVSVAKRGIGEMTSSGTPSDIATGPFGAYL